MGNIVHWLHPLVLAAVFKVLNDTNWLTVVGEMLFCSLSHIRLSVLCINIKIFFSATSLK